MIEFSDILRDPLITWAPYRIDANGTWDIKSFSLPFQDQKPSTFNTALSVGVEVEVGPYKKGFIFIESSNHVPVEGPIEEMPFTGPLGLFVLALRYFSISGISVKIRPSLPPGSALGGSSSALVALCYGLLKLKGMPCEPHSLANLAYQLEDIHQMGGAGMQDHLAAVYGGVNLWSWQYDRYPFYQRENIEDLDLLEDLQDRFIVCYTGKAHSSPGINKKWIMRFMEGNTRDQWVKANGLIKDFWAALKAGSFNKAAGILNEETRLRYTLSHEAFLQDLTGELIKIAEQLGCGARFTGAGGGGCVWAIGELKDIAALSKRWEQACLQRKGASLIQCKVATGGVRVLKGPIKTL